jgi:hypothetical protein
MNKENTGVQEDSIGSAKLEKRPTNKSVGATRSEKKPIKPPKK